MSFFGYKLFQYTILTWYYAPFDNMPPFTICINLVRRYICPQFMPPSAIHGKFTNNRRTLWLRWTIGRLELTVPTCIGSSYLHAVLASDTPTKWFAKQWQAVVVRKLHCVFWPHTLYAFVDNLMILCPAELSHYELHRKSHEMVTDNSAIAVSLARSTAGKGSV